MKRILGIVVTIFTFLGLFHSFALCESNAPRDMGIPCLYGKRYTENDMNMTVYWVQVQLKATGRWYQGEQWDCTGNLGDHTMHEIASFMKSRGYPGHTGSVDQDVVNELANYLGNRVQSVYVGGFYDAMGSIMTGGSTGSMQSIVSNFRDMVPRETVGARWVQVCLKHLGYYKSVIDGKYGEETERSVMAFQRNYGFEERDYVSLGVARAMIEAYYHAGGDLNELSYRKRQHASFPRSAQTAPPASTWKLAFLGINKSPDDPYATDPILRVGDTIYFHARLNGGKANEKVLLHYQMTMNGELIEENAFSESFGNGSFVWVRNTPFRHGTLMVTLSYYDNDGRYHEIGSKTVQVEARTDQTQTETARGWIASCDLYFNRYGSLCFDLSGEESINKSIIFFIRNEHESHMSQGTVSGGSVIWDTPIPGRIYEYAIWCGQQEYAGDVAALSASQIPASAWIRLYVTANREIFIVSSNVAIHILENE